MPTYRIEHIHHETSDVASTAHFYQHMLGATPEHDPMVDENGVTWSRLMLAGLMITITDRPASTISSGRNQGLDHLAVGTDDFDGAIADLRAKGVEFWMEPQRPEPGKGIAFIKGPDNSKIELLEY
ncbi:MAG: VOC family protein [Chloroflexota bacterium]